jgi:1,4-alpha-glucan branching enzyme
MRGSCSVSALGAFTFVLHSHLPYARLAGRWPHGEEWIHEAATETYIPLLETLYDLRDEGTRYRITIGITPILGEQLADEDVKDHLDQYLEDRIAAAKKDIAYFEREEPENEQLRFLAGWYQAEFERVKSAFDTRFNRDLIGAFKRLQDEGYIEVTTCAATHGYLPLMSSDSTISAQLKAGIASYERMFGHAPTGIWLPECAYRPAYITETGRKRPGLEYFIGENGLKVFFSETHTITGGQPVGVAGGDVIGPYGEIKRRYVIPESEMMRTPERQATTFQPYYVSDTTNYPTSQEHSGVAVIGRNNRIGQQVWSAQWGYPGDFDYREFHRKAGTSGIQYWRISGEKVDLGGKDLYHPDWASYKVDQHAEHFAHLVSDELRNYYETTGKFGLVSANYDTELFGHWWFEGVSWLGKVLRHLASNPDVELTTASRHIDQHPPQEVLNIPESSWGAGGTHFVWDNNDTHWMWTPIHEAEARMEALANEYTQPSEDEQVVLSQAAREALLLESSDWPFLVTTGQAREYAIQRFSQHLERFNKLASSLEAEAPNVDLANEYWELDKVFPNIDYRWFRTYQP